MSKLRSQIRQVAPTDAKVLITGDSGVGKELVARALHKQSARANHDFVPVNCAGLTETLLESELFGHVKGSFTGAFRDQPGKLELAHHGTVFLDELGEMTPRMQSLLLRFLETGELQKVGADQLGAKVDVRVIAATNRDLQALVREGTFREDLLLSPQGHSSPCAAAARAKAGHSGAGRRISLAEFIGRSPSVIREVSPEAMVAAHAALVAGQRPRARKRPRADGRRGTARSHSAGRPSFGGSASARRGGVLPEHRQTTADELYKLLTEEGRCFWTTVYPLYMQREITRANVRDLVRKALEETCGSYRVVARMFNMDDADYKRFLNFLRKHDCQVPYRDYRLQTVN